MIAVRPATICHHLVAVDGKGNLVSGSMIVLECVGLTAPVTVSLQIDEETMVTCDAATVVSSSTITCVVPQQNQTSTDLYDNELDPTVFKQYQLQVRGQNTQTRTRTTWKLSLQNSAGATRSSFVLDGFPPVNSFRSAELVTLTDAQKASLGRNDRPGRVNNLLFAFEVDDGVDPRYLTIRAPRGFIFDDDCREGLEVARTAEIRAVGDFAGWGSRPSGCIGDGNIATIYMNEDTIQPYSLYAFLIKVTNPALPVDHNFFTMEVLSQASVPFPGFALWSLQEATLTAATTALSEEGAAPTFNYIHIQFSPYTRVLQNGTIEIIAPEGFIPTCNEFLIRQHPRGTQIEYWFVKDTDFFCEVTTVTSDDAAEESGDAEEEEEDEAATTSYLLKTMLNRSVDDIERYSIFLRVENPSYPIAEGSSDWRLRTYSHLDPCHSATTSCDDAFLMDEVHLPTFPVYPKSPIFDVSLPDIRGNTTTTMTIDLGLPLALENGDVIEITLAKGFQMPLATDEVCTSMTFLRGSEAAADAKLLTADESEAVNKRCECVGEGGYNTTCTMSINVNGDLVAASQPSAEAIEALVGASVAFEIQVINAVNPGINEMKDRMFTLNHKRLVFGEGRQIISSRSTLGPVIRPQFGDVRPMAGNSVLIGPSVRAGSRSTIGFFFTPMNDAEAVRVQIDGEGFDFRDLVIQFPPEATVDKETIDHNVVIIEDKYRTHVAAWLVLTNVHLGFHDEVILHIQTYADKEAAHRGDPDEVIDEKLNYAAWLQPAASSVNNNLLEPSSRGNGGAIAAAVGLAPRCDTPLIFSADLVLPLGADETDYFWFDCTILNDGRRLSEAAEDVGAETGQSVVNAPSSCRFLEGATISFGDDMILPLEHSLVKLTGTLPKHTNIKFQVDGLIVEDCGLVEDLPRINIRVETWKKNAALPLQSNDGIQTVEGLRAKFDVNLHAVAAPPSSVFELAVGLETTVGQVGLRRELTVKQIQDVPYDEQGLELWLIAPTGFTFVGDENHTCGQRCLVEASQETAPCGGAFSEHSKARLLPLVDNSYSEDVSPVLITKDQFFMNVLAPNSKSDDEDSAHWWVLTCPRLPPDSGIFRDAVIGWGVATTFEVTPMPTQIIATPVNETLGIYSLRISFHLRFPVLTSDDSLTRALPAVRVNVAGGDGDDLASVRCPNATDEIGQHPAEARPVCSMDGNTIVSPLLSRTGLLTDIWTLGSAESGDYITTVILERNLSPEATSDVEEEEDVDESEAEDESDVAAADDNSDVDATADAETNDAALDIDGGTNENEAGAEAGDVEVDVDEEEIENDGEAAAAVLTAALNEPIKLDIFVVALPTYKIADGVEDKIVPLPGQGLGTLPVGSMTETGVYATDRNSYSRWQNKSDYVLVNMTTAWFITELVPINVNALLITAPSGVTFLEDSFAAPSLRAHKVFENSTEVRVLPGGDHLRVVFDTDQLFAPGIYRFTFAVLVEPTLDGFSQEMLDAQRSWFVTLCANPACRTPADGPPDILFVAGPLDGPGPGSPEVVAKNLEGSWAASYSMHFIVVAVIGFIHLISSSESIRI